MRLEARVAAGFIDFDHEIAVIIIWHRCQDSIEVDYTESWLAPESLGGRQVLV